MTISRRRNDLGDDRLKAAIAFGFGWTGEQAAEFSEVSLATVKRWKTDPEIRSVIEAVAAARSIDRSRNLKDAVNDVVESAEDRVARIFDRSLKFAERILHKAEEKGDSLEIEEAKYIYENIAKWAAKYRISEAPKRMEFEGKQTTTHVHVLSLPEAANILATRKEIESVKGLLVAGVPNVIDAELA